MLLFFLFSPLYHWRRAVSERQCGCLAASCGKSTTQVKKQLLLKLQGIQKSLDIFLYAMKVYKVFAPEFLIRCEYDSQSALGTKYKYIPERLWGRGAGEERELPRP